MVPWKLGWEGSLSMPHRSNAAQRSLHRTDITIWLLHAAHELIGLLQILVAWVLIHQQYLCSKVYET